MFSQHTSCFYWCGCHHRGLLRWNPVLRTSKYRSCVGVFYMYICMYMYIYSLHLAMCTCTSYVLHVQSCIHVRVMYMYVYIHQTHLMAYDFVSRTKVRATVNEVFFLRQGTSQVPAPSRETLLPQSLRQSLLCSRPLSSTPAPP
jgi:hypothetical protein